MSDYFHIDFESYSEADLSAVGAYRYAADPSTEILMLAIARNKEAPWLWVNPRYATAAELHANRGAMELLLELERNPHAKVYAHNAQFETAMAKYRWVEDIGTTPPLVSQWRCTATMARVAALPASLEKAAEAVQAAHKKDPAGGKLIKMFSVPQKVHKSKQMVMGESYRILPQDNPDAFTQFGNYCLQDVRTEQDIHSRLRPFELTGDLERAFVFSNEMNDWGLPINVPALQNALRIVQGAETKLAAEFRRITGLKHTQGVAFRQWLAKRGYHWDNLQAATVEEALTNTGWALIHARNAAQKEFGLSDSDPIPEYLHSGIREAAKPAVEALTVFSKLSFAAVKKIAAMLACDCGDGYVRGTLKFYGAGTGRWSGQLVQPQNFKRPTIDDTAGAYAMICDGCSLDDLELMYGDAIEVVASCIRHFIQPHNGLFLNADYSSVEARIVCWLADQWDALQEYIDGHDRYVTMACAIYGKRKEHISKMERWVGKQAVLGCGFSMWVDAFQAQCAKYGQDLEREVCETAVLAYRQVHHKVADLWNQFETAAKAAINVPSKWFAAGTKVRFASTKCAGIKYLVMALPSGRKIVYPHIAIEKVRRKFKDGTRLVDQITYWGQLPQKVHWGRVSTYGGKLVENATQGTAFDLMAYGSCNAEREGFRMVTLIHDEALALDVPGKSVLDFCNALCKLPPWADGLPLAAEGSRVPYYRKD